jgi:hypothetical protein
MCSKDSSVYLKVHHFKVKNLYIYTVIRDKELSHGILISNLTFRSFLGTETSLIPAAVRRKSLFNFFQKQNRVRAFILAFRLTKQAFLREGRFSRAFWALIT